MMEKILYVTDLDGTLLNKENKISLYSSTTINTLVEQGMIFTYATARSLYSALPVTTNLTTNIPVIIYNGCAIVNAKTKQVLYSKSFTNSQINTIKELMNTFHVFPLVYSYVNEIEKVTYDQNQTTQGMDYYLNNRKNDPRMTPIVQANLYQGKVFYFTCIGNKEELEPVYLNIKDNNQYHVLFHQELYREEYWLEIMPSEATKANAILKLKEILEIDKIISFGDAINDLPMFSISDECYAVENAVVKLKQKATGIIESNQQDGVAKWLKNNAKW